MRTVTKKYEVFTFDELEKEVQEKLLEEQTKIECENYCESCLYDDMENRAKELLQEYFSGSTFDKVYYDLSYCQGNGAQVNFTIDVLALNKKYNFFSKKVIDFLKNGANYEIKVKQDGFYYHEKAFKIDWYDLDTFTYYEDYLSFEELDNANNQLDKMIDLFREDITKMNIEFKKYGYELVENEEYFKNIALDKLELDSYLKDGKVFEEEVEGC